MIRRSLAALAALSLFATSVSAAPLAYINSPMDTPQNLVNLAIAEINAGNPANASTVFCSGSTTATCQGVRMQVSVTGLTTLPVNVLAAQTTVTDASVVATSQVICQVVGYGGTGMPGVVGVVPAAGTFTFYVQNQAPTGGGSLNATVPVACLVYN